MSEAIEAINRLEEQRQLLRLVDAQRHFLRRYVEFLPVHERDDFEREFAYILHLVYREAQEPLVKQLTEVFAMQNRPMIFGKEPA